MSIINYFAYGSNMNWDDLDQWCRKKNCKPIDPGTQTDVGYIEGYKLVFDKYSETRGGGALNIKQSSGNKVYGVLFYMQKEDFTKVSKKEGEKYKKIPVNVVLREGRTIGAKTFKAENERELSEPTPEYLEIVLQGAKKFLDENCYKKIEQAANKAKEQRATKTP